MVAAGALVTVHVLGRGAGHRQRMRRSTIAHQNLWSGRQTVASALRSTCSSTAFHVDTCDWRVEVDVRELQIEIDPLEHAFTPRP